jgi:hypothetical protein
LFVLSDTVHFVVITATVGWSSFGVLKLLCALLVLGGLFGGQNGFVWNWWVEWRVERIGVAAYRDREIECEREGGERKRET